jgi:hypothetical protein
VGSTARNAGFSTATLVREEVNVKQKAFPTLIMAWLSVPSLILFLSAASARAQIGSTNYTFVVASGFVL